MNNRPTAIVFRADPTDPRHGTDNGYRNLSCRCERCRTAHTGHHPRRHWEAVTGQAACHNDIRGGIRNSVLLARTPSLVTCESCKRIIEHEAVLGGVSPYTAAIPIIRKEQP